MGNANDIDDTGEQELHGEVLKDGVQTKKRNPDTLLHLDGEKDTLYEDGLEVEDDSEKLADTRGSNHRG